jgi:hypothetical protein
MRDMLDARKRGDFAFRDKDFKAAIDCYSQVGMLLFSGKTRVLRNHSNAANSSFPYVCFTVC